MPGQDGSRSRRRRTLRLALPVVAVVALVAVFGSTALSPQCGRGGAAIGCATPTLAPAAGISLVTGYGHLTGVVRQTEGRPLHEFEIERVEVLVGPAQPETVRGWLASVNSPGPDLAPAQVPGLWAPDGHLLAEVSPEPGATAEAPTVRVRPIVNGDVVFSAADCGAAPASLTTQEFDGPLAEVPDSRSYSVARCNGGFEAAPLREVLRLLG